MKAIHTQLQINRVTMRADDSVSFSAETPALTDEQLVSFRGLSKVLVNCIIEPEVGSDSVLRVEGKVDGRSPSQRLRSVLYVLWEQSGRPDGDFEVYYRLKMNQVIEWIKGKLD